MAKKHRVTVTSATGGAIIDEVLGELKIDRVLSNAYGTAGVQVRIDGKDYDTGKPIIILPGAFPVLITEVD